MPNPEQERVTLAMGRLNARVSRLNDLILNSDWDDESIERAIENTEADLLQLRIAWALLA